MCVCTYIVSSRTKCKLSSVKVFLCVCWTGRKVLSVIIILSVIISLSYPKQVYRFFNNGIADEAEVTVGADVAQNSL